MANERSKASLMIMVIAVALLAVITYQSVHNRQVMDRTATAVEELTKAIKGLERVSGQLEEATEGLEQ